MSESGGWSTIESDEGVFTSLIDSLGVRNVQFEELISLDADSIRSLSPVYGVIFLFKWSSSTTRSAGAPQDGEFDETAAENGLFFANQTIQNACGTQAVLSVILNQDSQSPSVVSSGTPGIDIGPELRGFKEFTTGFPSDLRGEALSNSDTIRNSHNAFARASPFIDETSRPPASEKDSDVYHFIAYTPYNGKLYELDGLQPQPISHGACTMETFPEKVIGVLQRRIARYPLDEIRFNLMAVVRDLRVRAEEIGDFAALENERLKRQSWAWENALRKCNFVGFIGEALKGVTRHKLAHGEPAYQEWVDNAKKETQRRLLSQKGQRGG